EAVTLVHECSGGIARSVSVICDNALVSAMALGRRTVDRSTVSEVVLDLRLKAEREQVASTALVPSLRSHWAPPTVRPSAAPPDHAPADGERALEDMPSRLDRARIAGRAFFSRSQAG